MPAEIERAERAVANARRRAAIAGRERVAGRITKGCHRDAVAMLAAAEVRLAEAVTAAERRALLVDFCDEEHEAAVLAMSDAEVLAMLHDFGWTPDGEAV